MRTTLLSLIGASACIMMARSACAEEAPVPPTVSLREIAVKASLNNPIAVSLRSPMPTRFVRRCIEGMTQVKQSALPWWRVGFESYPYKTAQNRGSDEASITVVGYLCLFVNSNYPTDYIDPHVDEWVIGGGAHHEF